jgi:hypothetical protein
MRTVSDLSAAKTEVPPHAFLGSSGSGRECHRGYRNVDPECPQDGSQFSTAG